MHRDSKGIAVKVVKTGGEGTAVLSRQDAEVSVVKDGRVVQSRVFASNAEAKRFMQDTATV